MSNSILLDKSKAFALEVIRLCNEVKADFIARLHIALKECAESEYWLELLTEDGYTNKISF